MPGPSTRPILWEYASNALESAADSYVITDNRGAILYVNPACCERYGYDADSLLGRSPRKLAAQHVARERFVALQRELLEGRPVTAEIDSRTAAGEIVPVDVSCSAVRDGEGAVVAFLGTLRDISDRRRAERAELAYRELFDRAADYIIVLEVNQAGAPIIVEVNQSGLARLGYTREQLIGQPISLLDDAESAGAIAARAQRLMRGEALTFEVVHRCADGSNVPIEVSAKMIQIGERRLIYAVERDLSERRRMEAEFAQAHKMEAIGLLASGIAHDLNNVLAAVLNNAQLLQMGEDCRGESDDLLADMVSAAQRGGALTRNLLDFARSNPDPTQGADVRACAQQVEGLLKHVLPAGVRIEVDAPDTPVYANSDSAQLHQALLNLCLNASDAIGEHGTVRISVRHHDAGARVIVADDGCGMDEATLQRAKEPFFTTKPLGKGTGLGLAMVARCVERHGGTMTIRSAVGVGTEVELCLPPPSTP